MVFTTTPLFCRNCSNVGDEYNAEKALDRLDFSIFNSFRADLMILVVICNEESARL